MNNVAEEISLAEHTLGGDVRNDDNSIVILTQANSSDVNLNQRIYEGVTSVTPNCHKEQVTEYRNNHDGKLNARGKTLLAGDSMVKHICNQKIRELVEGRQNVIHIAGLLWVQWKLS